MSKDDEQISKIIDWLVEDHIELSDPESKEIWEKDKAAAVSKLSAKLVESRIESVELLRWKYKEFNDQSISNEFLIAYNIITEELQAELQGLGEHHE